MDRYTWLAERRAAVVADYDAEAPSYDMNLYPAGTQEEWVSRLVAMTRPGGTVLDSPCGPGRYFSVITSAGMRVVGVDQSAGMLARARARNIAAWLEQSRCRTCLRCRVRRRDHGRCDGERPA